MNHVLDGQEIPRYTNFYCRGRSPLLDPVLSQMNPIHTLPPRIFKIHSNIFLSALNKQRQM
jgi:hypothetical protein